MNTEPALPDGEFGVSIRSTLQHIALIQQRERKLQAAREEAEQQLTHRVGSAFRCGEIDEAHLAAIRQEYGALETAGRSKRWNQHVDVPWSRVPHVYRYMPNGPDGTWIGTWPRQPYTPFPQEGIPVVYVLYGDDNEPCYVGSTSDFRGRLRTHERDKPFTHWRAYRCRDRDHAYEVEDRLLKEHKPYLNKKASR